jgi:hypothetical protein
MYFLSELAQTLLDVTVETPGVLASQAVSITARFMARAIDGHSYESALRQVVGFVNTRAVKSGSPMRVALVSNSCKVIDINIGELDRMSNSDQQLYVRFPEN